MVQLEPEVFRVRLHAWRTLEEAKGQDVTLRGLQARSGINRGLWSMWLAGTGKYRSELMPSAEQWTQLKLQMGRIWWDAFEDVYQGVPEVRLVERVCPYCDNAFAAKGRQVYDLKFCRVMAGLRRDEERRHAPAAALRAV